MGDFGVTTHPVAQKQYRCDYCWWPIPQGEKHSLWSGIFDGEWQSNRMHEECADDHYESGDYEFSPGSAEPPERIKQLFGRGPA